MYIVRASIIVFFMTACFLFLGAQQVSAIAFDLIPPSEPGVRGEEATFIVDIDTQGETVTSTTVGMTYESTVLEYVSTTPGDAMNSVTVSTSGSNAILLTGSKSDGFNGNGVFAYVTFRVIAEQPGTTELCALFLPDVTPTPAPTNPAATSAPVPTQLPVTGITSSSAPGIMGGLLFISAVATFMFLRRPQHPLHRTKKR